MNHDLHLICNACGATALGDDEFCESCGRTLDHAHDASRHHFEIDRRQVAAVSDRGLVHDRNEDAVFVDADGRGVVAVVCDGVSSSAAPQIASAVAADVIGRLLVAARDRDEIDRHDAVATALAAGDAAVLAVPWMPTGTREAPACTVVAALWDGAVVTVGWAGDSRAYWLGGDGAQLLTLDHSWAQEQATVGAMSLGAAEADRRAHVITRWLGADAPSGEPSIVTWRPTGSGRLVLCSDGLWNHVIATDELAELVGACPPGASALDVARELTRTALARGGHDNVTVAVIDILGERS